MNFLPRCLCHIGKLLIRFSRHCTQCRFGTLGQFFADGRIPRAQVPSLSRKFCGARLHLDQRFLRFCFRQKHTTKQSIYKPF